MRKCTLTLIKSDTPKASRAFNLKSDEDSWTGKMMLGPSVGKSFCFWRDDMGYMHTSTIKEIRYLAPAELELTTRNSIYKLEIGAELE